MESIARISTLLENARELTLDAASAARSSRSTSRPLDRNQVKKLLDSRNDREVLDGLRRVISMMYRNQKTLPLFSSVVKNVASPNLEIKKLVYIYLIHHAEEEPDLALLSINTIQKSLSDTNPQVRALALRTMSGIRVPVISQIVSLAIRKGAGDMSPYVRRAAALAIPKCYRLDPSQRPQLLEYLATLLGDKQYYVAGAAVTAFMTICPDRIDMIHKHYRSLVKMVVDMDEWSQLTTLRLMSIYARKCFPRRTRLTGSKEKTNSLQDFYGEGTGDGSGGGEPVVVLDPDLELLLNSIKPLLQSRNSGVVVAVAKCYSTIGTPAYMKTAIGPLIALLRGAQDIQQVALFNIVSICLTCPADFVKYATHFLVRATDSQPVWELKLEMLTLIFPHAPTHIKSLILNELEHFSRGSDKTLVREAVRSIGRCAQTDSDTAPRCLRLLLGQITSLDGTLAAESLTVIRHLIQQDPTAHVATVVRLAKNLDSATDPQARATIIWLVGEFSGLNGEDNIAADVLRILIKDFASESELAKRQIVLLGAKVYLHYLNRQIEESQSQSEHQPESQTELLSEGQEPFQSPTTARGPKLLEEDDHPLAKLWRYLLLLVRYDTSYDLRDRTRLYKSLLSVPQLATLMLLAPKPAPQAPSPSETRKGYTLGSAALVLAGGGGLHGLRGYEDLPGWVEDGKEPDPSLRDVEGAGPAERYGEKRVVPAAEALDAAAAASRSGSGARSSPATVGGGIGTRHANGLGEKTLDDWLAEEEAESEEEEDEEEEEDDEEEEEEESGEEEEEESEEEEEDDDGDDDDDDEEEESDEESEEDARLMRPS
ncbi:AP-3 complex subunit beta-2 [Dichotomopilus funicola]|uniref:AP-3 complex subunit beta-2 n=1 Tax=Dichotomopilus funicola TaxID=1934379 RepID=A0AAN6V453_9PEZI|nr:AP-3 complex subunit beta-2 [Dichotomopilus funicola]